MKTSLFRSLALLCILSLGSLDGCKKTENATPQVTCQTDQYVSLDGTSNAQSSHLGKRPLWTDVGKEG